MRCVEIYSDGACRGNPGPGGWGALLRAKGAEKELWGGEAQTTNNRMELTAVIRALEALKRPSTVRLYTDSLYVMKGISEWIHELEAARLAHRGQEAGEERGPLARARRAAARARGRVALGQGPRRAPGKRAGRRLANKGIPTTGIDDAQIVLDTETTGLNAKLGDRIIEIGCVEILSRSISERTSTPT